MQTADSVLATYIETSAPRKRATKPAASSARPRRTVASTVETILGALRKLGISVAHRQGQKQAHLYRLSRMPSPNELVIIGTAAGLRRARDAEKGPEQYIMLRSGRKAGLGFDFSNNTMFYEE